MPFHDYGQIRVFTFSSLDLFGVPHGVITRRGGVSPPPWDSLNFGNTVGDQRSNVTANQVQAFSTLGITHQKVCEVWQVHGNQVAVMNAPTPDGQPPIKADSMLTSTPGALLFMRFADCVPILLYARDQQVIGLVHAGWQGTVKQAVTRAVETLCSRYNVAPNSISAALGPSIGPDHYEIGDDVVQQVQQSMGSEGDRLLLSRNGSIYLDLWNANEILLRKAGVTEVENPEICTACHLEDWYSHRQERGQTGRFGVFIALPE